MAQVGSDKSALAIETSAINELRPYARNARLHTKRQIGQIAASITEFGFTNPILTDGSGVVLAGHGRLEAAKLLGLQFVPTIKLQDLSEVQKRAYVIADNKLTENAGWNEPILAMEIQGLVELDPGFDLEITGFETAEIDLMIQSLADDEIDDADEIPELDDSRQPVCEPGDLWALGPHRLLCGDALKSESYEKLLAGEQAQLIFGDIPYNLKIRNNVSGLGKAKHGEFAMASGELSRDEFEAFLKTSLGHMASYSVDGAIHFICMGWQNAQALLNAGNEIYTELKNICVWCKTNAGMGSLYRSRHELVLVFKHGKACHTNNVALGRYGRNRSNVWTYAGVNTFRKGRMEDLAAHPTVKPVALVEDAILDCSNRGDIVLDAFAGSGTTLIAAERTGRRGYGIEIDPQYVDVTLERYSRTFEVDPIHVQSGLPFSVLK